MTGLQNPLSPGPLSLWCRRSKIARPSISNAMPTDFPRLPSSQDYWRESTEEVPTSGSEPRFKITRIASVEASLSKPQTGEEVSLMLTSILRKSYEKMLDYSTLLLLSKDDT